MHIYLSDLAGALTGPVELQEIPGAGVQHPGNAVVLNVALVDPEPGYAWVVVDGEPLQCRDCRGPVFSTSTGIEEQYTTLGELPDGLTQQPCPGDFHTWSGTAWVLDEARQIEAALAVERAWRNERIQATDYLVMPDYPLTAEQRAELYAYRQALRDWPAAGAFPDSALRPVAPPWVATQTQ